MQQTYTIFMDNGQALHISSPIGLLPTKSECVSIIKHLEIIKNTNPKYIKEHNKKCFTMKPSCGYRKKKIPEGLRYRVFERDDFTCKECGARKNLTVDHIKPESLGGETEMSNLQTLCSKCNPKKGIKYERNQEHFGGV